MRYHEILAKAIDEKGLLLKEVVAQCEKLAKKQGWTGPIKLDIATLSRLKDGKQLPPTEPAEGDPTPSKNRLLAQVLGLEEDWLVLAAALEHTPIPVLKHISGVIGESAILAATDTNIEFESKAGNLETLAESLPSSEAERVKDMAEDVREFQNSLIARLHFLYRESLLYRALYVAKVPMPDLRISPELKAIDDAAQDGLISALASVTRVPARAIEAFIYAYHAD